MRGVLCRGLRLRRFKPSIGLMAVLCACRGYFLGAAYATGVASCRGRATAGLDLMLIAAACQAQWVWRGRSGTPRSSACVAAAAGLVAGGACAPAHAWLRAAAGGCKPTAASQQRHRTRGGGGTRRAAACVVAAHRNSCGPPFRYCAAPASFLRECPPECPAGWRAAQGCCSTLQL
ncbi:hypothetical protein COO60DRAFT_1482845, partial [Scenedesmus sp. NREL 46B-D3]